MKKRIYLFIYFTISFCSCNTFHKQDCQTIVSDTTIANIISYLIVYDTLPVSNDLSRLYAIHNDILIDTSEYHKFDAYLKLKLSKLFVINDTLTYQILNLVNPDFEINDSLSIICQLKSDTIDTFINKELLSIKHLRLINQSEFDTLTLDETYDKYRQFFSFSRPFFFNNDSSCIVSLKHHCGGLCGDYWLYKLIKSDGNWIVINKVLYGES